jgi:hypothetical protein
MHRRTTTHARHAPICYHHPHGIRAQDRGNGRYLYCGDGLQRLEVLVAVMLARERRWPADTAAGGCTKLAAALATLPSGLLEMVADAVVALGGAGA